MTILEEYKKKWEKINKKHDLNLFIYSTIEILFVNFEI
jgi:hypothetical protein